MKAKPLFRIFEVDDYGRPQTYMGIFKASSEKEARELAAKYYKNKTIATTGFYGAERISYRNLEKEIKELTKQMEARTKILNLLDR